MKSCLIKIYFLKLFLTPVLSPMFFLFCCLLNINHLFITQLGNIFVLIFFIIFIDFSHTLTFSFFPLIYFYAEWMVDLHIASPRLEKGDCSSVCWGTELFTWRYKGNNFKETDIALEFCVLNKRKDNPINALIPFSSSVTDWLLLSCQQYSSSCGLFVYFLIIVQCVKTTLGNIFACSEWWKGGMSKQGHTQNSACSSTNETCHLNYLQSLSFIYHLPIHQVTDPKF